MAALALLPKAALSADQDCGCPSAVACPDQIIGLDRPRPVLIDSAQGGSDGAVAIDDELAAATPIWKTISLGTNGSADSLHKALRRAGCHVGHLADEVLAGTGFSVSKTKTDVDLVLLSPGDLGFGAKSTHLADLYARAIRFGFGLCPAEVAPQLRLQYLNQPLGEFLRIAMKPAATGGGEFAVLIVGNGGAGLEIIGADARPEFTVPPAARFVFVRPR
jgi:hypothetical protein